MSRSESVPPLGSARQPIVKAVGTARRARLLPAPDTAPTPHPPVLTASKRDIVAGELVEQLDIRRETDPHVPAFQKVMTE